MDARDLVQVEALTQAAAPGPLEFTPEQRQLIRDTFANGATDTEFAVLMEIARARRLNPLLRQIHFVSRWDSDKHRPVWATQVSIDGLRAIAERTGLYAGQDEAEFTEKPDQTLKLCKVRVYRKDWERPAVGLAHWDEYVQTIRDKVTGKLRPTAMWARMPHVMLAKVAEAAALRRAFPEDMAGLYTTDEMAQAQNESPFARGAGVGLRRVVEPSPAHLPSPLEAFALRASSLRRLEDAPRLWVQQREALARCGDHTRGAAWKLLCHRAEELGAQEAPAWLKRGIAEEDARRPTQSSVTAEPTGVGATVAALPPGLDVKAALADARRPSDPYLDFVG
ncbi:MAG: phage recombination protein Bet [Deltaproteobacteria bacterium]|nr:phage recombination protein Bet [Deltaproteobacteria bacterium]